VFPSTSLFLYFNSFNSIYSRIILCNLLLKNSSPGICATPFGHSATYTVVCFRFQTHPIGFISNFWIKSHYDCSFSLSLGQPKRHLLTTRWSLFVSGKRLLAEDSVLFIRYIHSFLLSTTFQISLSSLILRGFKVKSNWHKKVKSN